MFTDDLITNDAFLHAIVGLLEVNRSTIIELNDIENFDAQYWVQNLKRRLTPMRIECNFEAVATNRTTKYIDFIRERRRTAMESSNRIVGTVLVLGCGKFSKVKPRADTINYVDNYIIIDKDSARVVKMRGLKNTNLELRLHTDVAKEPDYLQI